MGRKRTTYRNPSILAQVEMGKGGTTELQRVIAKLEADGASHKTLKRLYRHLAERKKLTPINTSPVAILIYDETPVFPCAGTIFTE